MKWWFLEVLIKGEVYDCFSRLRTVFDKVRYLLMILNNRNIDIEVNVFNFLKDICLRNNSNYF